MSDLWGEGCDEMRCCFYIVFSWILTINIHLWGVQASRIIGTMYEINHKCDFCLLLHTSVDESILLPRSKFESNEGFYKVYKGWTWTFRNVINTGWLSLLFTHMPSHWAETQNRPYWRSSSIWTVVFPSLSEVHRASFLRHWTRKMI